MRGRKLAGMRQLLLACVLVLILLVTPAEALAQAREAQTVPWNDWRMWSVVAAFLGFTFGTLIKFGFDLWLDRIRKRREREIVAIEMQADMVALRIHARDAMTKLQDQIDRNSSMVVGQLVTFEPPRRAFLHAAGGRFGLLGLDLCSEIVTALTWVTKIRHSFAVWEFLGGDYIIKSPDLRPHVTNFRQLAEGCDGAIHSLEKITRRTLPGTE